MIGGVGQFPFEHQTFDRFSHQRVIILGKSECPMDPLGLYRLVLRMIDEIEDLLCQGGVDFGSEI